MFGEDKEEMINALKQIGKSICYVGLYFGMQVIVSFVAIFVATLGYGSSLPLLIIISGVLALLFLRAFFAFRKKKFMTQTGIRPFAAKYWPAVFIGSVGLCLFVNFGMQLLPIPEEVLADYAESSQALMEGPFIMLFVANAIMAPLVEEILFRGLVLSRLKKAMPVWLALVLSSFFFGLMHGQILWVCYTFLVGLVLGLAALKTDSTLAPMFMHFAFNLFGTCMGFVVEEVSGMVCLMLAVAGGLCTMVAVAMLWPREKV